jgi:hypothetical protein
MLSSPEFHLRLPHIGDLYKIDHFNDLGGVSMADRIDELRATAGQCLSLAQSTTDPQTRAALLIMAQKLNDMASSRPTSFGMAQQEFNERQMLPRRPEPQPTMQQQQQIQPKKEE